ncbi:ATP-dependent DNA helicase Q-like 5 [Phragmites australis]|uniref:ATP-dependent DNA helicase Q-like 5 n=1 Tax=Phragmites australis TaxID=29695 RepID=UPI002D785381|nr:ATP-dependent DNA helicase Q-like 5 [Phragmites australis]
MYSPPHAADSDSGGSLLSDVSASPPRRRSPPPPPPPKPRPNPKPTATAKSKPKPKSKPVASASTAAAPPPLLPAAALSDPHGLTARIAAATSTVSSSSSSFRRLVQSRNLSFDPAPAPTPAEIPTEVAAQFPASDAPPQARPKRVHPNSVSEVPPAAAEAEQPKRPKGAGSEGNFVRLNINGYGRRRTFRNAQARRPTKYRSWRRQQRAGGAKPQGCGNEEADFVAEALVGRDRKGAVGGDGVLEAVEAAREDPSEQNLESLLKIAYGYDSFREGQLEAIQKVVAGASTMLVLPTGAGKSLCYQVPAMILPGLTLVVSPLLSLMVDQLRKLPAFLPGGLLASSQTSDEFHETLQRLRGGEIKVLFVSPERFLNEEFLLIFMDALPISLVAIDEAHCISEWSHNFRPSYLRLRASLLRRKLNVQCILAMTATATTQTLEEIVNALEIPSDNLIKTSQIRDNLQLSVSMSDNRLKDLMLLLKSSPFVNMKSIIVYCKFQGETDYVSKYLCDNNISAKSYHSGLPMKNRSRVQDLFCSNKIRVVVATVAFGMGLDKSDVEGVIHYSMPESLEEYIQETGRAGRDGRLSHCHLLLDSTTFYKIRSLAHSDGVDEYAMSKFLYQVFSCDNSMGCICSLVKESTSRKFDIKEEVLLTVLTQLEIGDQQYIRLLPQFSVTCTLYFHKTSPQQLADKDILVRSVLNKSETKDGNFVFNMARIANDLKITVNELFDHLQQLKFSGEISFELKDPAYCYVILKKPDDFNTLGANVTKWLSEVESSKIKKLDAMFALANFAVKGCQRTGGCSGSQHTPCIQNKIVEYFSKNDATSDNDHCTQLQKSSPFLQADIKVFLQSNSFAKFTPRAVARIMHGLSSPAFPSATWSKNHFWGRYVEVDFPLVMEAAKAELVKLVGKGE